MACYLLSAKTSPELILTYCQIGPAKEQQSVEYELTYSPFYQEIALGIMTSSSGNISCVTGPLCGEFTVTNKFPTQGQVMRSFFFICARRNGWVNNGDAGDLRGHSAHYDVTVMEMSFAKFRSFLFRLQWVKAVGIWNSLIQRELMRLLLTHYGIASHMPTKIWVNIGSGNGLLPDGINPLPQPMMIYHL